MNNRRNMVGGLAALLIAIGLWFGLCRGPTPQVTPTPTPVVPTVVVPTATTVVVPTSTAIATVSPTVVPTAGRTITPTPVPDPVAEAAGVYKPSDATSNSNCQYRRASSGDYLPDPTCTTGATNPALTADVLCSQGFRTTDYRTGSKAVPAPLTDADKRFAYDEYGQSTHQLGTYEVDHLISLENGGSNDRRNLWPEPGAIPNKKDGVENWVKSQICAHHEQLATLQQALATDWTQLLPQMQSDKTFQVPAPKVYQGDTEAG